MRENILFFHSMFNEQKKDNETFMEYILRFEKVSLSEFERFTNTIIKDITKDYNDVYSNPNSSLAKKLGFSFELKELTNKDFPSLEPSSRPFIQIRFKQSNWTQDFISNSIPFLHFECFPKIGSVVVVLKPNVSSSGLIKIGEFRLYDKIIINQIENYFFQFLQKVTSQEMSYA